MTATVHIIGAGLAGLSAALKFAARGESVVVHEATAFAGGRCRSYHDAAIGMTIDNGNHLLLSGNHAALDYLRSIGARSSAGRSGRRRSSRSSIWRDGERWTLRFNDGRLPLWIFDAGRRVPGTRPLDYLPLLRLLWAAAGKICRRGHRLRRPALPPAGAAAAAGRAEHRSAAAVGQACSAVVRETLAAGGRACRPLIARDGLGAIADRACAGVSEATQCQRCAWSISFAR